MRSLTSLLGNSQRLDGGAMFGNAPKVMWQKWLLPDADNRVPLACRTLLVRDGERTILFETGIGAYFEPKLKERYGVVEDGHILLEALAQQGLSHTDIHVVVLSHLHFDHAGGLLSAYAPGEPAQLLFPNATYVIGSDAWHRAQAPHFRDRASFLPELNALLADSGRLEIVQGDSAEALGEGYRFFSSEGHTPGMLLTEIEMPSGPVLFAADLIPGTPWVHLPITMGYDRYAERLIDEKRAILESLVSRQGRLFFTHDPSVALARVVRDERGRFSVVDTQPSALDLTA